MNNIELYNRRYNTLTEARREVEAAEAAITDIFKKKLLEKLWVISIVNQRMNRKQSRPICNFPQAENIRLAYNREEKRWEVAEPKSITFKDDHILITWSAFMKKEEEQSFKFPLGWLSYSTWELAAYLRRDIRTAQEYRMREEKKAALANAKKAERAAEAAILELQREAASYEAKLAKLQREVEAAKAKTAEVEAELPEKS